MWELCCLSRVSFFLLGMELRITQYGEPILREEGKVIETFDDFLRTLVADMIETMYEAEGVGLAAQQIDQALMLCVVDIAGYEELGIDFELDGKRPPLDLIMPMALVNPVLRKLPSEEVKMEEGCLSFPGIRGEVSRPDLIEVNYQDVDGVKHCLVTSGWFARVVQHEYDHLKGILFIDHMETRYLRRMDTKLKRLKRSSRDWLNEQAK